LEKCEACIKNPANSPKLIITKNVLRLASIVSITLSVMMALAAVLSSPLLLYFLADFVLKLLGVHASTLCALCGVEAVQLRQGKAAAAQNSESSGGEK